MAKKRSAKEQNQRGATPKDAENDAIIEEREGIHGERMNETQIDTEVASRAMEGGRSVEEGDVSEAFKDESGGESGGNEER